MGRGVGGWGGVGSRSYCRRPPEMYVFPPALPSHKKQRNNHNGLQPIHGATMLAQDIMQTTKPILYHAVCPQGPCLETHIFKQNTILACMHLEGCKHCMFGKYNLLACAAPATLCIF